MSDFFFRIDSDFSGERIDKTLSDLCSDFTRSHIQHIIDDGEVKVNGKPVSKSFRVSIGDEISFSMPELKTIEAKPENIPLDIIYEDDDLLVVNKPRGMVVHPAAGNYDGTLVFIIAEAVFRESTELSVPESCTVSTKTQAVC